MKEHGARPTWLSYISVDDVDATVASIEQAGGKIYAGADRHPRHRQGRDGRRPAGRAFLRDEANSAGGRPARQRATSSRSTSHSTCAGTSFRPPIREAAIDFYRRQFGWGQEGDMDMGEMGKYRFIQQGNITIGAVMRKPRGCRSPSGLIISASTTSIARRGDQVRRRQIINGPMEIPGGEFAINAHGPAGRAFRASSAPIPIPLDPPPRPPTSGPPSNEEISKWPTS